MQGRRDDTLRREADIERELVFRAQDEHQQERLVLFENETLALKVLQAVSGGSMIAAISQASTLIEMAGRVSFLSFLSAMGLALLAAVFGAHSKHQYKMWDVKARATRVAAQRERRSLYSRIYLVAMRCAMWIAMLAIAGGFIELLAFLWVGAPPSMGLAV
jgi:hypothetical protein